MSSKQLKDNEKLIVKLTQDLESTRSQHKKLQKRLGQYEARPEWIAAGDGTLHGAIDHWAERATKAEAAVADALSRAVMAETRVRELEAAAVPNEQGKNRYGVDVAYFREVINRELNRPLVNFRPDELARVFARLAKTADAEVLSEAEFTTSQPLKVPDSSSLIRWIEDATRLMRATGRGSGWHETAIAGDELKAMLAAQEIE